MVRKIRGRPSKKPAKDEYITPKVAELLDVLLEKAIISEEQHSAALYYRWLFNVKIGVVQPSQASLWRELRSSKSRQRKQEWYAKHEARYQKITEALREAKSLQLVQAIAIYNQAIREFKAPDAINSLRLGLDLIEKIT